jgi:glycosyltransferase involved in cell wall biosynthesis
MAEAAQQIFDVSKKSSLIYNGVNVDEWRATASQTELNYMLAIGRVVEEKGFFVLIKMFAEILRKGVAASLVIAGTGSDEAECRKLCATLGLTVVTQLTDLNQMPQNCVIFTGWLGASVFYLQHSRIYLKSHLVSFSLRQWRQASL